LNSLGENHHDYNQNGDDYFHYLSYWSSCWVKVLELQQDQCQTNASKVGLRGFHRRRYRQQGLI